MPELLVSASDLPSGFRYPEAFHTILAHGMTDFVPWYPLEDNLLYAVYFGINERYPRYGGLVPFARRQDNDDVACLYAGKAGEVLIIHDYASEGWELVARLPDIAAFLRLLVDDFIDFHDLGAARAKP
ncbi:hypothetical protein SAMN02983003_2452 [Devosia enhydra]|uniref:SMI1/KNR4 family protein n=1 Tax=Devosia enhydra TaxID=665118 RepID=A0A1K2I0I7_9HYPH|nr:hypothetical protein [Devosia enhydra]SFZ85219.1 hypothetical protein SAMN02983003_2452 [Devosia enhydra]